MPRRPKPYFHRGWWKTNVGVPQTRLAKGRENKAAAEDALIELLNERRQHPDRQTYPNLTVLDLCEKFLDWVELYRSQDTYDDYRDWLNQWVKLHGSKRARDIRSLDLEEWERSLARRPLSPWTVNHAVVAVKTCWSWAMKQEPPLLPKNPLQRVQKLDAEGRKRTFTPEEFLALLRHPKRSGVIRSSFEKTRSCTGAIADVNTAGPTTTAWRISDISVPPYSYKALADLPKKAHQKLAASTLASTLK